MSFEDSLRADKHFGMARLRLKQERERRAWTQSEVAERIGTTQVNVSRWERGSTFPSPYYRQKLGELFGKSIQELGFTSEETEEVRAEPAAFAGASPSLLWNVPYRRNPFFTGREEILSHLYTVLSSSKTAALTQPQAISGLGGIGKTQIAVEYAYRYCDHYQAIFWINATTRDALTSDFVLLAALLHLPEQYDKDQENIVRSVKRWLSAQTRWLLILDNVDDLEMAVSFLPVQSTGDVLFTTRLQALGTVAQSIEVEKMGIDEGMMFLLYRTKLLTPQTSLDRVAPENRIQGAEIVRMLDGLPLALDQAGAYIEETRCGLSQYLSLYRTRRKELLLRRGRSPVDHPDSVIATWSLSFEQVKQESPAAADLLCLLAFFSPEAIPEELLLLGASEFGPLLETMVSDPLKLDQLLELLLRYSLVRRTFEEKSLSMHRLVQAVLKDNMDSETQCLWAKRAIRAVNCAFPDVDVQNPEPQNWERCQRYLPHAQMCAEYIEADASLASPEAARLFNEAALYLMARARYDQAKSVLLKALAIRRHILEANHPDIARTLSTLGAFYRGRGKSHEAEPLLRKALAIRREALGEEHLDVAQTLYQLAHLYRAQGSYMKAEAFFSQALHIYQIRPGVDDLLVAQSYYGLALLYCEWKRYEQAEKFCQQALQIQEQHLEESDALASTLNVLARIYHGQNRLDLAKKMVLRALQMRENAVGPDHPRVATIINNLAELFHAEGRYREAEPFIARSLQIHEQSLEPEHPYMAYSLSNRAENLLGQGNHLQAEFYYKKALTIREQNLGFNHPHTATSYCNLAKLYVILEQYVEAETFYRKALSIREQVFDPEHPTVVSTLEEFLPLLRKLKKEGEALEFENRIMIIRAKQAERENS